MTCYICRLAGHYSNECDKKEMVKISNKKDSNFLVLNKEVDDSIPEEQPGRLNDPAPTCTELKDIEEEEPDPSTDMDEVMKKNLVKKAMTRMLLKRTQMMTTTKDLCYCKKTLCALYKTIQVFQAVRSYR